jgi:hypothetical protein
MLVQREATKMTVQEEEKQEEESSPTEKTTESGVLSGEIGDTEVVAVAVPDEEAPEKGDKESPVVEKKDEVTGEKGEETKKQMLVSADAPWGERMWEVFSTFWPLGLIAFGGPQVSFR